ncbi:MAG: anti-sigma factor [Candidatus Dadabacteria bacterium]|nr:anti-sigma factor [Candidatus Dadabacteria bacterium]MCZ6684739.1 anti-sigma factor [Candidatus Dadabacteria bacterium]
MEHEKGKYEDQITLFALGVLKGYELRQLEEHLGAGCEICEKVLRENELVLSSLAYSLDDSPLSPQVENKIFDRIEAQETAPAKSSTFSFWRNIPPIWLNLGSAIAVVLLIILFMNNMSLRNELSIQKQNLQANLQKETEVMDFIMDPKVDTIKLASGMSELDCSGKLLWETGSKDAILMVSNIPPIEEGKTYQFWVVENGEPHSMGTFLVGKDGHKMIEINCMPDHGGEMEFYVTLEPEGGMPHPTGATYLVGSL